MALHPNIDLNLFRVFLVVFKYCSISRAAEELQVTPASVSQSIKKLSADLHTPLFLRQGRGIVPTLQAQQLLERLTPVMGQFDTVIEDCLYSESGTSPRSFVIQAPETIIFEHIKNTERIHSEQSRYRIEWVDLLHRHSDSYQTLNFKHADAIIDIFQLSEPNMCNDFLFEDEVVVVASAHHPRINHDITLEQFVNELHVILNYQLGESPLFDMLYNSNPPKRQILATLTSLSSMLTITAQSETLCLCPKRFAQHHAKHLPLQILTFPGPIEAARYWLIYPFEEAENIAIQWLKTTLMTWMVEQPE
ncbi:LysR family transcriptional regulator [Vibrio sp. E150_011]